MNKAVVIHIERNVGETEFEKLQLQGSLPAVIEGIAVAIQEAARAADVPAGHLVSVLATVMLTPRDENTEISEEVSCSGEEERPEA